MAEVDGALGEAGVQHQLDSEEGPHGAERSIAWAGAPMGSARRGEGEEPSWDRHDGGW